jgi:hypothetical protein
MEAISYQILIEQDLQSFDFMAAQLFQDLFQSTF